MVVRRSVISAVLGLASIAGPAVAQPCQWSPVGSGTNVTKLRLRRNDRIFRLR